MVVKCECKSDCTDDADDASSACPRSESRNSVLLRSCDDESRDRFILSLERLRSRPRSAAAAAKIDGSSVFNAGSQSGLMPCCARYKSTLFIRFCGGGGVKWLFRRSSDMSHGTDVEVYGVMFI